MDEGSSVNLQSSVDLGLIGDHRNLGKIRALGRGDKKSQALALKAAAEQFQSILNQYWVDAMRKSNDTINPDSPLHSKYSGFFEDMLAQQNVATMTQKGGVNKNSITYLLTKQFAKSLGDEGKELLKELDKMSVSGSTVHLRGANVPNISTFTSTADNRVDKTASLKNLRRMYEGLPAPESMKQFASHEEFVEKMMPYALKAVEGLGFNPLVLVAQAALETGWGKHVPKGNNYYGIKANSAWKGESEKLSSPEFANGRFVNEVSAFRKYADVLESMQDYISFIHDNPRYSKAVGKSYSPDEYFEEIQRAGYATDPGYAEKLKNISRKIAFMAYK
jgi:flagellar protein FlgJ